MKRLMLISNTKDPHTQEYFAHCRADLLEFLGHAVNKVLFVPYARPGGIDYDRYTALLDPVFAGMGYELESVHKRRDKLAAVESAEAIFVGGGNTFVLLDELKESLLSMAISTRVNNGTPYIGSSAGANVACPTIATTNDNPIAWPLDGDSAMHLVPFQIKPHYFEPPAEWRYSGETHADRIREYHALNGEAYPVLGLRENSWLVIEDKILLLRGEHGAKLFVKGEEPREFKDGDRLDFLIDDQHESVQSQIPNSRIDFFKIR